MSTVDTESILSSTVSSVSSAAKSVVPEKGINGLLNKIKSFVGSFKFKLILLVLALVLLTIVKNRLKKNYRV